MSIFNKIEHIRKINAIEYAEGVANTARSWHMDFKDSAYIIVQGLHPELTEADLLSVFSQYGEIIDINLVRDKATGVSKGFAFMAYMDQRSTILAVDNFTGIKINGRAILVDHVKDYKPPTEQ